MHRAHAIALSLLTGVASAPPAWSSPVGGNFEISGANCRFPDAAHGSVDGRYLVVWADYNETRIHGRFVTGDGSVDGAPFPISEAPYGALFPAVAYNVLDDEFLVTWDDFNGRGEVIHGQRVRAASGALAGANFAIGSLAGGIRSAVAWSAASNVYLVAYFVPGAAAEIYGQRVSGAGALLGANFNISRDGVFSGYPAVAWGESGNQFLVTWDNDDGNIHGRRVDAATGALLGAVILVTAGGAKDRSCIAYDPLQARWLVQYNDGANAGFSYDQYGRLVNAGGSLAGGPIPLAHTAGFEGDTQFGGDVACAPAAQRFFSSFGTDTGMGGQESFASGAPAGPPLTLGTGFYTSLNNAADAQRNRFLTVWEGLEGAYRIYGQLYGATLGPPVDFSAEAADARVLLSWRNPDDPHFTGTLVRFRNDGYPAAPGDGEPVADEAGAPGSAGGVLHAALMNWTTYYYAAFAHDGGGNFSLAARTAATPRPAVITLHASDFDAGADGWTLASWRAGALSPGTIAWDASGRNIVAAGSGVTNNLDTCTREGGLMTRAISTAGRRSIQIEYEATASLHAPPGASAGGSCAVLEGGIEDKLAVYYSTTGTNGPWLLAQVLTEGIELPGAWTRRLVNLAGVAAAGDNPEFALRFQWQFNHERDSGRVDAIRVLSGAVTGPAPAIGLTAMRFERSVEVGENLPADDVFFVSNTGEGVLNFTAGDNASWLSVSPAGAASAGPPRRVSIGYDASGLAVGDHEGAIIIVSAEAANSPQTLAVLLHVLPRACYRDAFNYYDGELTTMGSVSWGGSATSQILVEDGTLKVAGGGGAASAAHSLLCTGAEGLFAIHLQIRKGAGTCDFFWNIAIDDDSGNTSLGNLARWYGGSTIARGRVGGVITDDFILSGTDVWDDLCVRIDTAANTSEFFFNGASHGTISHGSGPSGRIGAIRIERLDRAGAGGDSIHFDELIVESASLRLFHRGDPDASGATNLADVLALLNFLFLQSAAPACAESADANNDLTIDISDGMYLLFFLFAEGPPPPPPGPPGSPCGADADAPGSDRDLGCGLYAPCGLPE